MSKPYYFGAGPAALPLEVLQEAQAACVDWQGKGISILEVGHRTDDFAQLMSQLEKLFRTLLSIPSSYYVLWMGCAARTHFGLIPLHFIDKGQVAGFWLTGLWSKLAYEEAKRLKTAVCIASSEPDFLNIPDPSTWPMPQESLAYVYATPNETIQGVRFFPAPHWGDVPMVADMTSCLMTESIPIEKYGLIFAGAQKNLSNAGLSVLIISPDMMQKAQEDGIPMALNYKVAARHHSLYVTPPTFNCFVMLKMLQWLEKSGGMNKVYEENIKKAETLYEYIDKSGWYKNNVAKAMRSRMNIPFRLPNAELERMFIDQAKSRRLIGLEGHKTVGGLRVSLYNAMPMAGVEALLAFMQDFKLRYA